MSTSLAPLLSRTACRTAAHRMTTAAPWLVARSATCIDRGHAARAFSLSSCTASHENPLGLPRNNERRPPTMPRRSRGGVPDKRPIPWVKKVLAVSSGKGGVGKSTIAANLALALAETGQEANSTARKPRIGLLDLDIFGPSVPKLMGLESVGEPELTPDGALIPLTNHGIPCMSMGFLLPPNASGSNADTAVVWRGMMVMKATQQLLFDVDWRSSATSSERTGPTSEEDWLDVLVVDMPPGTGDVALSLSQLVKVDGAVVVSTPQQVALIDARKGVAMFEKVGVPITGLVLNMSHFVSPETGRSYPLFGPATSFDAYAAERSLPVLGRIPLQPDVSTGGDGGVPTLLRRTLMHETAEGRTEERENVVRREFLQIAKGCWKSLMV